MRTDFATTHSITVHGLNSSRSELGEQSGSGQTLWGSAIQRSLSARPGLQSGKSPMCHPVYWPCRASYCDFGSRCSTFFFFCVPVASYFQGRTPNRSLEENSNRALLPTNRWEVMKPSRAADSLRVVRCVRLAKNEPAQPRGVS